jgi:hypothetical protein
MINFKHEAASTKQTEFLRDPAVSSSGDTDGLAYYGAGTYTWSSLLTKRFD